MFCTLRRAFLLIALAVSAISGHAQPTGAARELLLVVPNEPGGGLDLVARLLAKELTPALGAPVVVLNRSGASGNVGTVSVARAEPDGHTLLLTGVGHLVSPLLHANPGYDPLKDFAPVAKVAEAPNVLVVHTALKGLSLTQLLQDPRSRNTGLAFASAGYGHSSHLAAEVLMSRTGARWLHVPYRGTGPASRALIGGEVQLMLVPVGSVKTMLATGQVHALAVAHPQRLEALPSTPTLAELGITGAEFSQWYGVFAPAGTPPAALRRLQAATLEGASAGELRRQLQALGLETAPLAAAEFGAFLAAQAQRLSTLVRREGVEGAGR
jgi:tripartite-type tricarboxylate transporter receptor subunit TctC